MANNKVDTLMDQVKWADITNALATDGRIRLADYAEQYGVSIPTMRKMFEAKYGVEIEFRRGRTGGVYPTSKFTHGTKDEENAENEDAATEVGEVTYDTDTSVEKQVDAILGVEA